MTMPPQSHEQTVNVALGEVLQSLGKDWTVSAEQLGLISGSSHRLDVLIEKRGDAPVVVEAEIDNLPQAEREAVARLGQTLRNSIGVVDTAVALNYPRVVRSYQDAALRAALRAETFEYVVFSRQPDGAASRFPAVGALRGGVIELALLLHRATVPAWRVDALATKLEEGISRAAADLTAAHRVGSTLGKQVAKALGQADDDAGQTRRMAMAVLINALIFQSALAEAALPIAGTARNPHRNVLDPGSLRGRDGFRPSKIVGEWKRILAVNYWPIFHTAIEILTAMPTRTAAAVLDHLWETAEELIAGGVTKSHDLTGIVFQRLIADRQFLKTYYTRPASAALLAALAFPMHRSACPSGWGAADEIVKLKIGDFACGTGTLLSSGYQRLALLHELHGGDPKRTHPMMMKEGLVGLDVLQVAVHLTAAMLASSYAETPFRGDCLLTVPYGRRGTAVAAGSLDLLVEPANAAFVAAAVAAGGRGRRTIESLLDRVGHDAFHVVMMNPPFARHGAREGEQTETHNPAFAAFEATEDEQDALSEHVKRLERGGCAHGHAGMASYFVELAHRKLTQGGVLAFVLPLSAMSGNSWEGVRALWRQQYSELLVVTVAESGSHSRSFSADTGMAECLVIGRKTLPPAKSRATFAVLKSQPQDTMEGELVADAIAAAIASGVRKIEDGPFGGTRALVGASESATLLSVPIPEEGAWQLVGLSDFSLAQTAFQLANGRLWIEGMAETDAAAISVATVGAVSNRIGPHDLDITGATIKSDGLPQGPFEKIAGCAASDAYPSLWNHDNAKERQMQMLPDSHLQIRQVNGSIPAALKARAAARWQTASRAHYNRDLQFNAQSTVVGITERATIGGRAWPAVVFEDESHIFAFALWSNSTLGGLIHWWMSNKTQAGRGTTTPTSIPLFPTLAIAALDAAQLVAAKAVFDAMKNQRLLPFDQIDEDPVRAELDRRLLVDVLGLDPALCAAGGPMELLRRKLAAEPQIHGNKQTRVVFTPDGETTERRTDR
jgi:hypothetical protein